MKERPRSSSAAAPVPSGTRRSARIAKRQLAHQKAPSNQSPAPAFEWTPLDKTRKEIRILELAQGAGNELLSGQLYHAFLDLSEKPPYEAISYVWGGPARHASIVINNALVAIPASADSALRCMRSPNDSRRLWIDCVCIDQNNELEKGHQVGIMSEIFTFSQGTLAHLGDDDGFAQSAVKVFEAVKQWYHKDFKTGELSDRHKGLYSSLGLTWNDMRWRSVCKYLDLPYFRRLWIVQEAALAVRTTFHCGSTQLDCGAFLVAANVLSQMLDTYVLREVAKAAQSEVAFSLPLFSELMHLFYMVCSFRELVTWVSKEQEERTIAQILYRCEGLESTDPRDRIFGLLGLIKRLNPAEPLPLSLTPDYNKPLAHVYRDVTRAAVRQKNDLDMLLHSFDRRPEDSLEDLPSWVPPWYSTETTTFWIVDFNAGKGFPQHCCDRHMDPSILTLASFVIGEVKGYCQFGGRCFDGAGMLHLDAKDYEAYFSVAEALTRQWAPSDESMHDRLGRTLIGGCTIEDRMVVRANTDSIASFTAGNRGVPGQQMRSSEDSLPSLNEPSSKPRSLALGLVLSTKQRFFVTNSGHIGLGPRSLEEGDVVAVLGGGKCPFVLRPAPERGSGFYTMVGPAYVDGIMDGEAVQEHMEQGREIETIHLI